jgi:pimeloyl-ACP methyl ester carboxylesterase
MPAPIILVPGFWLGAWAWDEVARLLRAEGHRITALTLPGLESAEVDRSSITLEDQVDAIVDAVRAEGSRVVLAVHSGASVPGYAASDRVPDRIAAMVYVDTAPSTGAIDPEFVGAEKPLPSPKELAESENLTGLSDSQLATFRRKAIPEPGAALRDAPVLKNDARLEVPSTVIATGYASDQYKEAAAQGYSWVDGLNELRNLTYVDLPTSHWPMWSRASDLAVILSKIARSAT